MWERFSEEYGVKCEYDAWAFGDDPDGLANLVLEGTKTGTSSAYDLYALEGEKLPKEGGYSVILDSRDEAVCVIKTVKVYVTPFNKVSADHAFKEGEGDRSLEYWRAVHKSFFEVEFAGTGVKFDENTLVVCEEFEVVYR